MIVSGEALGKILERDSLKICFIELALKAASVLACMSRVPETESSDRVASAAKRARCSHAGYRGRS